MTRSAHSRRGRRLTWSTGGALLYAVFLIVGTRPAPAGINVWTSNGPPGGSIEAIVIDPTASATLYVGNYNGGVFKSTDGGNSWRALGLTNFQVTALAIDPRTPTTLYAVTSGGSGVFKSTDGGGTWSHIDLDQPTALAVDPKTPTTLYAAVLWVEEGGQQGVVLKSTDGGGIWSATGLSGISLFVALAIDPTTSTTLYAGIFHRTGYPSTPSAFKSTDGGGTWSGLTNGLPDSVTVSALAIAPKTPTTLYAGTIGEGLFKSTDGGGTWSDTGLDPPGWGWFTALAIDPTNPTTLYAGVGFPRSGVVEGGVYKSTDGGGTWRALTTGLTDTDVRALAIDPKTPTRLYAGTSGGLFAIDQVSTCVGDCDGTGSVTINEIITLVNIALGNVQPSACPHGVPSGADVDVALIIQAVNHALSGCGRTPPRSQACKQQDEAVQAAVDETRRTPNAIVAVKNEACGGSLYASGNPADATTASLFLLASVTKTFIATSVLSLVKEGKLGLDDPIKNWIAGLGAKYDPVTVRMLLKHTSGIFNYTDDSRLYTDRNRVWKPRELVDLAVTHNPYFAPGAGFHYCNTNYILLGMVLEAVTGEKLGSVLHQHAIDRAGLKHTFFLPEEPVDGQMATQFYPSGQKITNPFDPSFVWAVGGMVSSAADVVDWVWALYGSQTVLDPAQIQEMTDDSVVAELLPDFAESRYGQGVIIGTFAGTNSGPGYGHSGRWDGTSTDAYYFKDIGTAVVVLQNVQFWPPKVGDEAVLVSVLGALAE